MSFVWWTFFSTLVIVSLFSSSLVSLFFFADIHGLYVGPVTEVSATKEAVEADEDTVTVVDVGNTGSGTTAAVAVSLSAIVVTLTALKMM